METFLQKLFNTLKPNSVCVLCYQCHLPSTPICHACCQKLTITAPACQRHRPPIDYIFAPYIFDPLIRKILHEFKYQEGLYLAEQLASLMLAKLPFSAKKTECLIPVPLHRKKLRHRGFNQSIMITKHLSQSLQIPYDITSCKKIINTQSQAGSTALKRKINLRQAFQVNPMNYRHVTIIDDLYTTGNTAHTLAIELKKQGVQQVDFWCFARVLTHQNRTDFTCRFAPMPLRP